MCRSHSGNGYGTGCRCGNRCFAAPPLPAPDQSDDPHYVGVRHEFFGMAAVVDKAKEANQFAEAGLPGAFGKKIAEASRSHVCTL